MAIHTAIGSYQARPRQPTIKAVRLPAPTSGIDARVAAAQMPPEVCLYSFNLIGGEYGMKLRNGYREWTTDVESAPAASDGVHTLMAFDSNTGGTTGSRLFAVTAEGIWDVTDYNSAPTLEATFTDAQAGAGHGVYCHYVDQAGKDWLMYADEINGLWEYDSETGTWAVPTGITGPNIALIAYVVVHKQRMWLVERNSSNAWYLPVASKTGAATAFYFGAKFQHGGTLRGLYNWTVDGGAGVDDYLVAISGAGDVIPYRGTDPSDVNTWTSVGTFFVGSVPNGRNFCGEYIGNLFILSSFGLISMSDLLRGVNITEADYEGSLTYRIAAPIRAAMHLTRTEYGWEPKFLPQQGVLIINQPALVTSYEPKQWVQSLATRSWGEWRGVPVAAMEEWHGSVYIGGTDNIIRIMDGTRDKVLIDTLNPAHNGYPIKFSLLTSYQDYGEPAQYKMVQMVRPDFFSQQKPSYQVKVYYDYELVEFTAGVAPPEVSPEGDEWDSSLWDAAIWNVGTASGKSGITGELGMGRTIAIAMQGESDEDLRLLSFDVMWKTGGMV